MKLEEILNKYIYIFMRTGAIHEIPLAGRTLEGIAETLSDKGIVIFEKEGLIINSVDITEIMNVENYIKWINQRRPKSFFINKETRSLGRDEIYGEDILKAVEKRKELGSGNNFKELQYKN